MSRVTSEMIQQYHQKFSAQWAWPDLMARARAEAIRTGVEFMAMGESELRLVCEALKLAGAGKSASRWVEIGSLTGNSALGIASVLASGSHLWTLEKSSERCQFLRELFSDPRLQGQIHVVEGDSRQSKESLIAEGPFDGVFIDGAKAEYFQDLLWAENHLKPGGLILADNVFLAGDLFLNEPAKYSKKQVEAVGKFLERLHESHRYSLMTLPTSDGFVLARQIR